MKWLGGGGDGPVVATEMENGSRGPQRSQDDAAVGYVFQRPPDPEFTQFDMKQGRWALGDDTIVENHDKWKYPVSSKVATPTNSMSNMIGVPPLAPGVYDALQAKALGAEHLVYLPNQVNMQGIPMHQYMQQNVMPQPQSQLRNQIAPAAKKLWGLEGGKDAGKLALHPLNHEQVWRDPTWSTPVDHAVSQPIAMSGRRAGTFPAGGGAGGDSGGSILSPRGSDTGGLGVKMVEYVLGSSPTSKDSLGGLEPRMRGLGLGDQDKDKDKAASPLGKEENGVMQNGTVPIQNGVSALDDDKGFNRTPGSRQPSPAEEELTKNTLAMQHSGGVVILKAEDHLQQLPAGYPHLGPPPHGPHGHGLAHGLAPGLTLSESVNQHFEHFDQPPGSYDPTPPHLAAAAAAAAAQSAQGQYAPPPQQQVDSSVLQQQHNFDVQQLFRSQQNQALGQAAAAAAAAGQPTAAQLQLIQQQQYLAAQQQPLQTAAAFPQPQYVLNPQAPQEPGAPYVGTLITAGVPQYYGVAPWVYPANIIQQGTTNGARRPLTPSGTQEQPQVQGGYIVPYYDQNASILMAQGAAMRNGTPMRLVSPAPVLVQPQANRQTPAGASLYSSTPQSLYGATVNTSVNGGTLGGVTQAAVGVGSGLFPTLHAPPSAAAPFGSSSLGTIGSPATTNTSLQTGECGIAGLGLNTSSTGRRDSFDRNTSAFSPSLEYRPKWPAASYGLGSSPSPLTGSLTPPPSAPLQLGGLVNSRVLSAAPGAEAKYRASTMATGLTANAMFGSTNSLFTKLNAARPNLTTVTTSSLDKPQGRSRLLEDFRNNRFPNLQLRDLANHIVEFSQDQHGSRFIQQKLERATVAEKQLVFSEILSAAYNLMTDVFGNYVIQKFFEFGTPEQKTTLAQKVRGNVLPLALQMYGCRVIQKALESIGPDQQQEIVRELDGHVLKCVKDQNGNHVVQKCIECVEPTALQFIINSFSGQVYSLSTHPYGCRVIQRILEHCTPEQTAPILKELHAHTEQLIQDQFGNYVIQHVLEHGNAEDKSQLIAGVRGKVLVLSQHKFASNVVEKCVTHATRAERALLIEEVCGFNDNALHVMMKDQYANYVVQKMIDVSEPTQRKVLMHKIRPHLNSLRKYTYGKHIIAKLEKFLLKSGNSMSGIGNELGPIGPPANGVL